MTIWNRPKKRGKLIYEYILLMMAVGVIILLPFWLRHILPMNLRWNSPVSQWRLSSSKQRMG